MNEVATKQLTQLAVAPQAQAEFDIVQKDLTLPRILLTQAMSDRAKDGRAKVGEYILSGTDVIVAEREKEFNIIPLTMRAVWANYEMSSKRGVFKGTEPRNNSNSDLPWQYEKDGKPMKRVQSIELLGLLPSQVLAYNEAIEKANETGELPDLENVITPVGISFQSMSFKFGGKSVAEFFTRIKQAAMSISAIRPYSYVLTLKSAEETSKENDFFVSKVTATKKISDLYPDTYKMLSEEADKWARVLSSTNVSISGEDEVSDSSGQVSDLI